MIAFQSISAHLPNARFENLSLRFEPGLISILMASFPERALFCGLLRRGEPGYRGKILLENKPLENWDAGSLERQFAFAGEAVQGHLGGLNAGEVVRLGCPSRSAECAESCEIAAEAAMEWLDIGHLRGLRYDRLPPAKQCLVRLARAMVGIWNNGAKQPGFLILDEPILHGDLWTRQMVMRRLVELKREGFGVVWCLSEDETLPHEADRVSILVAGRLAYDGSVQRARGLSLAGEFSSFRLGGNASGLAVGALAGVTAG